MMIKFGAHLVDTFCLEHHLGALRRSAVFSVFLLGACGSGSVPSVELEAGEVQLSVSPHSSCWGSGDERTCGTGHYPDPPPDLGSGQQFEIAFPHDGWEFFVNCIEPCADTTFEVSPSSERRWIVDIDGPHGDLELFVSGFGPQGDVQVAASIAVP